MRFRSNSLIDVQFSHPLNITTISKNIAVSTGGQVVPVQLAVSNGDQRVRITPAAGLQPNAQYVVAISSGIADLAGLTIDNPGSFTFQTAPIVDKRTLSITTVDPANGTTGIATNAVIRVAFNKRIDAVTMNNPGVLIYPTAVGLSIIVPATVAVAADGLSATFTPNVALQAQTQYGVYINGITDLQGQVISQNGATVSTFTTGAGPQTGALTVTAVSPPNATTGVPVNATVQVQMSAAVSAVSVTGSAIQVSAGGTAVAGTVSITNPTLLRFTPASALAVSTVYTVTVGGFTDLTGNAVQAFSSSFTTGASGVPDTTAFTVTGVTPVNNATGVAVTTTVVLTFNKTVNPVTATLAAIPVTANGVTVAGSYAVSGATVTFTPLTPLPGSATVNVGVNGNVADLAGNGNQGFSSKFTTAATADTTPPTIVSLVPSSGATGVGLNAQVSITFSKSMNPNTLTPSSGGFYNNFTLLANGGRLSFTLSVSSDNRTVTLSGISLPVSTVVTLVVSHAVQDLSGNALADFQSQFTTAASFDTSHGSVVNQRPANGTSGVGLNTNIVLFLSKAMNAATVPGAVHISQNGTLVSGTATVSSGGQAIVFTPSSPWQYGALVQVFLDATAVDTSGNTVTAYQGSFSTLPDPAVTAPGVVNSSPLLNATNVPLNAVMEVGYSGTLDATTLNATDAYVQRNSDGTRPAVTIGLDSTGTVIRMVPSAPLAANTLYCYFVQTGVKGTNGKAAGTFGQCFTTGTSPQTTAPTVQMVSPPDLLGNVPVNANIRVLFSGPIDPLTVNSTTIQISAGGVTFNSAIGFSGAAQAGVTTQTVSISGGNQLVLITPENPLPVSTVLTLTVAGVKDLAGNIVPTSTTHFTTGTGPDTITALVVSTNPPASATNVPLNVAISLQTNVPIDPLSVSSGTFRLYDRTTNLYVTGTASLSPTAMTAYFVPAAPLATGRLYSVFFNGQGMTDLVGNLLTCCGTSGLNDFNFTTGFASSTTAPQVTGVSPGNGLTQVPLNARIVIQFNEPVNGQTLNQVTLSAGGSSVSVFKTPVNGNQTLILLPVVTLSANTVYTLNVAGVSDFSGNTMSAAVSTTFTTGSGVDFTQPVMTTVDPANGTIAVPTNTTVKLRFNKQVALSNTSILIYPTAVGLSIMVPATVAVAADGLSATFTPNVALQAQTQYGVYINGITDLQGQVITQNGATVSTFTTGAGPQTGALTVTAVSPPNATTGVPVNATVQLQMSAAVSAVSVTGSAIQVSAGGTPVAGTVSITNPTLLRFTPASALAVSTAYTVTVGGFTDLAGNAVQAFSSSFTTGASGVPDTTAFTVTGVTPVNNATGVAVTTTVVLTFNKTVNPVTATVAGIPVTANGVTVAGSYAVSGATVTFTPLTPLPGSATVNVGVNGNVADLAGNGNQGFSSKFTTAATADTTPPTIVSLVPSSGATGVGLNAQVLITFSKSMNPNTLTPSSGGFYNNFTLLANGGRLSFTLSVSSDNRTVTLSGISLPVSTVVTLVVSHAVPDLSGNALADFQSQFTTAASFDTSHGSVVNQRPANGTTGVGVNTSIVLFVSKAMNAATVPGAVHVSQNGHFGERDGDGEQRGTGDRVHALVAVAVRGAGAGVPGCDGGGHQRQHGDGVPGIVQHAARPGHDSAWGGELQPAAQCHECAAECGDGSGLQRDAGCHDTECDRRVRAAQQRWDAPRGDHQPGQHGDGDPDGAVGAAGGQHALLLLRADRSEGD